RPQTRGTTGQDNRRHRRTHKLADVLWPAQAKRKPSSSARRRQARIIQPASHAENPHRARRRVPQFRLSEVQPRRGAEILRAHVQRELFRVFLVSEGLRPWSQLIFAFCSPMLILIRTETVVKGWAAVVCCCGCCGLYAGVQFQATIPTSCWPTIRKSARGRFDWLRAGDENIYKSLGAWLPIGGRRHVGDADESPK